MERKTIQIVTKREAMSILTDSLFKPVNGRTLSIEKYCNGKYKWHGSQKAYVGREESVPVTCHALYVERRTDSSGPYAQVMCVTEPWQ